MQRIFYFCFLSIFLLFVGCSKNVPLSGTVTFGDDGSPLTVGTVNFLKDGKVARGEIQENGTYIVGFERERDGLPPGTYQVFITGAQESIEMPPIPGSNRYGVQMRRLSFRDLIDPKHTSAETSGLTVAVDRKTRTFDIQVDRAR